MVCCLVSVVHRFHPTDVSMARCSDNGRLPVISTEICSRLRTCFANKFAASIDSVFNGLMVKDAIPTPASTLNETAFCFLPAGITGAAAWSTSTDTRLSANSSMEGNGSVGDEVERDKVNAPVADAFSLSVSRLRAVMADSKFSAFTSCVFKKIFFPVRSLFASPACNTSFVFIGVFLPAVFVCVLGKAAFEDAW